MVYELRHVTDLPHHPRLPYAESKLHWHLQVGLGGPFRSFTGIAERVISAISAPYKLSFYYYYYFIIT